MNGKISGKQIVNNTVVKRFNGLIPSDQYLVSTNDYNITLSINSSIATHSFNIGWQGELPINRGGTNNTSFNPNELIIANATASELISSGFQINDLGNTQYDIWTAQNIINYIAGLSFSSFQPSLPTVNLTSNTIIPFNQTNINNYLEFNYVINNPGASASSAVLEWRRNNTGSWTVLSSNINIISFTHSMTDSNFNPQVFNYRYSVLDSRSSTQSVTYNIFPISYTQPTNILNVSMVNQNLSIESDFVREKGNVISDLTGSITRTTPNVDVLYYKYQFRANLGTWEDIGGTYSIGPSGGSTTPITHNPATYSTSSSIQYRIVVMDEYTISYNTANIINFYNVVFYGYNTVSNSNDIRNLQQYSFSELNTQFNLQTGTTSNHFTIAFPSSRNYISSYDNTGFTFTVTYLLNNSITTAYTANGDPYSYKVYTFAQAVAYDIPHNHLITLS